MIGFVQEKGTGGSLAEHRVECFYGIKEAADKPATPTKGAEKKEEVKEAAISKAQVAQKEVKEADKKGEVADDDSLVQLQTETTLKTSAAQTSSKRSRRKGKKGYAKNPILDHVPSDATDLEITAINEANLTWKADVCML